jgi:integral membrane protein (TIGR01906 family)
MKKLSWITGILVFAAVLLAALGSVCGAVDQMATDQNFYNGMSRAAVAKYLHAENNSAAVTEYIGLTDAEQDDFAKNMAAFVAVETDEQPDILTDKEQQHMLDVRNLTQGASGMSKTYLSIAAALAVVAAWTGAKLQKRMKPKLIGALSAVSILMLIIVNVMNQLTAGGFGALFTQLHEALFTNDLWLMNPETDILIRMMPQQLFEQALLDCAVIALRLMLISTLMLAALHFVIENMIRRHVTKG